MNPRSAPAALRRTLHLRRRPLAALCAFGAVLAGLLALTPPRDAGVRVLAARGDLPAGTVLAADHLLPLLLPADAVPERAVTTEGEVVGRTLGASLTARTVLTAAAVSEGRVARPGFVVVALPLHAEGVAALVRPGLRIDVLDSSGRVIAADVRVLAPPDPPASGAVGLGSPARVALVEVTAEAAATIASQGSSGLTVALR